MLVYQDYIYHTPHKHFGQYGLYSVYSHCRNTRLRLKAQPEGSLLETGRQTGQLHFITNVLTLLSIVGTMYM